MYLYRYPSIGIDKSIRNFENSIHTCKYLDGCRGINKSCLQSWNHFRIIMMMMMMVPHEVYVLWHHVVSSATDLRLMPQIPYSTCSNMLSFFSGVTNAENFKMHITTSIYNKWQAKEKKSSNKSFLLTPPLVSVPLRPSPFTYQHNRFRCHFRFGNERQYGNAREERIWIIIFIFIILKYKNVYTYRYL